MLLILPLTTFVGLVLVCRCEGWSWRMASIGAALAWAGTLTLITEGLSLIEALTRTGLALAWLGVIAIVGLLLVTRASATHLRLPDLRTLDRGDWWALGGIGIVWLATLVVGLAAPPTAVDSMTYHVARVAHWASNATVAHYPTHVTKQLFTPPWSEYAMLHIYVLTGSDRLLSLVQWSAMAGTTVAASLIAGLLGAALSTQIVAGLLVTTLPVGIAQASSTLNGYVNAFWITCLALLILRGPEQRGGAEGGGAERAGAVEDASWLPELLVGLALGIAGLTKGTAYMYGLPLVVWLAVRWVRRLRRSAVPRLALVCLVAFAVNLAFYARNHQVFGSPLGPVGQETPIVAETFSPPLLVGNVVRHFTLQFGTPWRAANRAAGRAVERAISWIGDESDDPRILSSSFRINKWPELNEGAAQNTWHLLLILAALGLLIRHRDRFDGRHVGLALVAVAGVLLVAILIKWRPWHSRHHLAFLVMGSSLAAVVIDRRYGVERLRTLALVFLLLAVPWMVRDENRPLLGRSYNVRITPKEEQYFIMRRQAMDDFRGLVERSATLDCRRYGFDLDIHFEYPIWALLQRQGPVRIRHVAVDNPTAGLREPDGFEPCLLLTLGADAPPPALEPGPPVYVSEWTTLYGLGGEAPPR